MAFSPDGKRLASLFDAVGKRQVSILNLETGAAKAPVVVEGRPNFFFKGPGLEATPDGQGWLVQGDTMIDGDTAAVLWTVPSEKQGEITARAVALNQVLTAHSRGNEKV